MTLAEPPITVSPHHRKMLLDFLETTGYGPSDILSLNYDHRTFFMRNGGKYIFEEDGTVTHLQGPDPDPSERL